MQGSPLESYFDRWEVRGQLSLLQHSLQEALLVRTDLVRGQTSEVPCSGYGTDLGRARGVMCL